jgi:hypothetical protein
MNAALVLLGIGLFKWCLVSVLYIFTAFAHFSILVRSEPLLLVLHEDHLGINAIFMGNAYGHQGCVLIENVMSTFCNWFVLVTLPLVFIRMNKII